eukprot:3513480-Prymnesium_polylepis.2
MLAAAASEARPLSSANILLSGSSLAFFGLISKMGRMHATDSCSLTDTSHKSPSPQRDRLERHVCFPTRYPSPRILSRAPHRNRSTSRHVIDG